MNKLLYQISYYLGQSPWDTENIPPQIVETIRDIQPGVALDLGCGTGTHSIFLAQHGWHVIGIDFISKAIKSAEKKARMAGVEIDFRWGDLMKLTPDHIPPVNLVLDVMCIHALPDPQRENIAEVLASITAPEAILLMESVLPRSDLGFRFGLTQPDIQKIMQPAFIIEHADINTEEGWYWLRKSEA